MSRMTPSSNPHMQSSRPHRRSRKHWEARVSLQSDLVSDLRLEVRTAVRAAMSRFYLYLYDNSLVILLKTIVETRRHQAEWT